VLAHLGSITSDHPGAEHVRLALGSFELPGETGPHVCIVHEPLGLTLGEIRKVAGRKLPESILKHTAYWILLGLDFLHSVAHVVHTGTSDPVFLLLV
jgi:hypothetical protein